MGAPVSLNEAKLFLRVTDDHEDERINALVEAARAQIEAEVGMNLTDTSPAPLRLALLMLILRAHDGRDESMSLSPVEAWVSPYRTARL